MQLVVRKVNFDFPGSIRPAGGPVTKDPFWSLDIAYSYFVEGYKFDIVTELA